jgi:hypothetical protein
MSLVPKWMRRFGSRPLSLRLSGCGMSAASHSHLREARANVHSSREASGACEPDDAPTEGQNGTEVPCK